MSQHIEPRKDRRFPGQGEAVNKKPIDAELNYSPVVVVFPGTRNKNTINITISFTVQGKNVS